MGRFTVNSIREGVVVEKRSVCEENGAKEGSIVNGVQGNLQVHSNPLKQLSQGSVVHWEKFLPRRSLKVLLVEDDDSTRHVVSALLRNCSYEVTAVANGLQAWKILQDLTNDIDLVLTEVVMPSVSGISLLAKIMSHKTCNIIPVIMMSSHDSMNIVFKCLSKGAVDFLVKPIRKNELKNLWQHVWRRCQSSSDSASESGIRTQKTVKLDHQDESENRQGSNNDGKDSISLHANVMGESDNGSGTQSSCTKRVVEVYSPKRTLPWEQSENPPDSTCFQGIGTKLEPFGKEWVPTASAERLEQRDERLLDNVDMGKDLEIGVPGNQDLEHKFPSEKFSTNLLDAQQESKKDDLGLDKPLLEAKTNEPIEEVRGQVANLIASVANSNNASDAPNSIFKALEIRNKAVSDAGTSAFVELSLKRLRGHGDTGYTTHEDRNVVRRSDCSAFSRYNNSSTASKPPIAKKVGLPGKIPEAVKMELMISFPSNSSSTPTYQQYNNNNDMGSTTKNAFTRPADAVDKSSMSAEKYSQVILDDTDDPMQVKVQHHHHHYHHYHHHVHNSQKKLQQTSEHADAAQCETVEEYTRLGGSGSGSNHGSNKLDGSGYDVNVLGVDIESENGLAGKSGSSGRASGGGADMKNQLTREAALEKFRQKRKERCFEKKVRYQSRKMLAEQRPRIRGQFVRPTSQISLETDS